MTDEKQRYPKDSNMWLVVPIGLALIFAFIFGSAVENSRYKRLAIRKGHAHYEANDKGFATFMWNSPCGIKKKD